jgi:hypothetical protein
LDTILDANVISNLVTFSLTLAFIVDTAVHSNLSKSKKKKKKDKKSKGENQATTDSIPQPSVNVDLSPTHGKDGSPPVTDDASGAAPDSNNSGDLSLATMNNDDANKSITICNSDHNDESGPKDDQDVDRMAKILARQWYWRAIAMASFLVGAGCLFLSMNIKEQSRHRRRFSRAR